MSSNVRDKSVISLINILIWQIRHSEIPTKVIGNSVQSPTTEKMLRSEQSLK
jgi:hypothetical protein